MKTILPAVLSLVCGAFLAVSSSAHGAEDTPPNQLTDAEKTGGWKLLFDGTTTKGWRSFKKTTFPTKGWMVEDGWLKKITNAVGGDIITDETFNDFELQWEWKVTPNANSGVKYFITEERSSAIGHEYQMMDDIEGKNDKDSTASFYEVLPPSPDKRMKPAGQINHSRIIVKGQHVEHWLNGAKTVEYELGSEEVRAGIAKSKFKNVPGFGTKLTGHILLTDHHDETWFRNIKIKPGS